jgi:hypothetical protein
MFLGETPDGGKIIGGVLVVVGGQLVDAVRYGYYKSD